MSMDILDEELDNFITIMNGFNDAMAKNWDDLQRTWESANELWDDSTDKRFREEWSQMGEALKRYREDQGQRYIEFLIRRKRALDAYFGR